MSMRWKPYPAYKDSGVEWLGRIPEHWEARRMRFATVVNPSKSELRGRSGDTVLSFLPMERIGEDGALDLDETRRLDQVAQGFTYFRDGDVLIAKITPCFENGKGGVCRGLHNGVGFGTTELHVLRPLGGMVSTFLFYVTKSTAFRAFGTTTMYGAAGQRRVSEDFVRNFVVGLPPTPEQQSIAAFLDRETARIDALVAKKERLIELLQEKRTALVSHAVTQGLNPDAPMKDSGIPWLGRIPAHWEVKPLKTFFDFEKGRNAQELTAEYIRDHAGDYPVYSGQTDNDGVMGRIPSYRYDEPEVIFTTTVGARVMTPLVLRGRFSLSQNCLIMRPRNDKVCVSFVFYHLHPLFAYERGAIPSYMQPSLRIADLNHYSIGCPTVGEQRDIAAYLDAETAELDALTAKVRTAIERLQEYRTALISAAVTGQIDVRPVAG